MHARAQPHPPSPSTIPVHSPSPAKTGVGKRPDRAVPPAACSAEAEGPPRAELEREPLVAAPPCPASWTLSSLGQQLPSPDPQSQFPWGTTLVGSTPLGRSVAAVGAQAPRTTSPARVPLAGCPSHTHCSPTLLSRATLAPDPLTRRCHGCEVREGPTLLASAGDRLGMHRDMCLDGPSHWAAAQPASAGL